MTTTTALATPARPQRTGAVQGLVRATLRLHRSALWFWLLLIAVAAGVLLWMYGWGADAAFAEFVRKGCAGGNLSDSCDYSGPAQARYDTANTISGGLISFVPLLTALWAGTSLIGRELENGTAQLAWTQSVSPARWLAAKLAVPAALLTAGTLVLVLLHRLAWGAHTELFHGMGIRHWYDESTYVANGTLAPAYALLGLAVGALTGLVVQRSMAASGGTFFAFMALVYVISSLRPQLWPVKTLTSKDDYPDYIGMVVGDGALTSTGKHISDPICVVDTQCLADHDVVGFYRDYHPSSHFWPLQLMETGVVLAVAAAVTAAAFWLLRRRTG
ncbi:ABC transporter permease subunit [Streptomyces sp. SID12488]|uniref:ABC transporter permease subunit n=1 Tax=Streptomyces sp. SID12488 TaxID=2706040 RepID=UPI0013DB7F04|nr:ABC transporter permease subunit [Streptomyces sp. SID12488]NEA67996.1 ABC transporter permease [Streptomyces sp. SID12488]